jgi:hypothetical protein
MKGFLKILFSAILGMTTLYDAHCGFLMLWRRA